MHYREATAADAEGIAAIHTESWRTNYRGAYRDDYLDGPIAEERLAFWQDRLSVPRPVEYVLIAEDGGEPVGFACAVGEYDPELGTYLNNIHVRGEWQSRGVGKALLLRVASWSLAKYPGAGLHLGVLEQNVRGQRFYQRHGAADAGGDSWSPPGGGVVSFRTYTWSPEALAEFAVSPERVRG